MTSKAGPTQGEGLKVARLLMVLSSVSPLFILWAIRGSSLVSDSLFIGICAGLVALPNLFLAWRLRTAREQNDKRELSVGTAEDHRDHILVYLFAMMLPFYSEDIGAWRDLAATIAALAFIIFLFWHLNLHYMNLIFALGGYRVFTIYPPADDNPHTGQSGLALITKRVTLEGGMRLTAYRISDTVYLEVDS